jgi:hypothetical protein
MKGNAAPSLWSDERLSRDGSRGKTSTLRPPRAADLIERLREGREVEWARRAQPRHSAMAYESDRGASHGSNRVAVRREVITETSTIRRVCN